MILQIFFAILLIASIAFFTRNVRKIIRHIRLGKPLDISDRKSDRVKTMLRVAFGQTKMMVRPLPGILHFFVYAGFVIINIEVAEILIDGLFGTHRILSFTGHLYNFLIGSFEFLAAGVLIGCVIFFLRRNVARVNRFWNYEMTRWPRTDANLILVTEIALMTAFLTMNAADLILQQRGVGHYIQAGMFPVSSLFVPGLNSLSSENLIMLERGCWWFHIVGILLFLNYLPYSKHFHIILAFPNTYYSNLHPKGKFTNSENVTREVKLMLDPSSVPADQQQAPPSRFGARDIADLTWKNLMDAYSCTECGRCTSVCPAHITGKKLSPRKIMMDTRDRMEEIGRHTDQHGQGHDDGKSLLNDYITPEELWACTTCNGCTDACPVNIDPLAIIVEMRRFLVMEQSAAPNELNIAFTNIENNGAPWQMAASDRLAWAKEMEMRNGK